MAERFGQDDATSWYPESVERKAGYGKVSDRRNCAGVDGQEKVEAEGRESNEDKVKEEWW